jgi:hypothetical protein
LVSVSLDCRLYKSGNGTMLNLDRKENDVRRGIARLPKLRRRDLLALWQDLYGREAPSGLRRELLIPFLAYRIQEKAFGGLKSATRADLSLIAKTLERGDYPVSRAAGPSMKSGTRLIRSWSGKQHQVVKTETGFEYCGSNYRSLSEIARRITGTRWSGPAFFGLRRKQSAQDRPR